MWMRRRSDVSSLEEVLARTDTITFDCYGTLVDWRAGLSRSFRELFGSAIEDRLDELFDTYVRIEADVEADEFRPYWRVLATVVERLADRFGLELHPERTGLPAQMLPDWPVFADTNEALVRLKQRYRLGVLSNIDRDLFAATARQLDVVFDFVVTAEDVRAYKPARAHFHRLFESHGRCETTLHVAQSLFHDGGPANQLGLAYIWINRYKQANETSVRPLAEYPDLRSFADVACGR